MHAPDVTPVITSGNDGSHGSRSLHFEDAAIDIRGNNITNEQGRAIANDLRSALGDDNFDIIFEIFPGNPANDHLHLEFDPPGAFKAAGPGDGYFETADYQAAYPDGAYPDGGGYGGWDGGGHPSPETYPEGVMVWA